MPVVCYLPVNSLRTRKQLQLLVRDSMLTAHSKSHTDSFGRSDVGEYAAVEAKKQMWYERVEQHRASQRIINGDARQAAQATQDSALIGQETVDSQNRRDMQVQRKQGPEPEVEKPPVTGRMNEPTQ